MSIPAQAKDNSQKQADKAATKAAKQAEKAGENAANIAFENWYTPTTPYGQAFPGTTPDQLFRAALYVAEDSGAVDFADSKLEVLSFRAIGFSGIVKGSAGVQVDKQGVAHLQLKLVGPDGLTFKSYIRAVYDFLKNNN